MLASAARIEANRRNSMKSTGPKSPEGKDRSRVNALKHGLCASIVGLDGAEVVRQRSEALQETFTFGGWLVDQVASLSLKIERAEAMQEAARTRSVLRAELAWDDDRRFEASTIAGRLANRPDQVAEKLHQTLQGCRWLISRWSMLIEAAEIGPGWTAKQSSLALDLLGTPLEFRELDEPHASTDRPGRPSASVEDQLAMARREIADLEKRCELARDLDAADRRDAESGLSEDAELKRLRRYEAALHRRLRWTLELIQGAPSQAPPTEPPPPSPEDPPAPPSATEEAAEIEPEMAAPRRSWSRVEQKLRKAEVRREARRRKLDKLLRA